MLPERPQGCLLLDRCAEDCLGRRRWTLVVVPHDNTETRSFSLSEKSLGAVTGGAAALVLLLSLGFGVGLARFGGAALPACPRRRPSSRPTSG